VHAQIIRDGGNTGQIFGFSAHKHDVIGRAFLKSKLV
jgi:hypothetical protein